MHLFEKEARLGGHTNTVLVSTPTGSVPLDTGFLVHNDRTYPNLVRLFGELEVATRGSDMSFSVSCQRSGLEYSSSGRRSLPIEAHGAHDVSQREQMRPRLIVGPRSLPWRPMSKAILSGVSAPTSPLRP